MNVVMTGAGHLVEVQGTAEGVPFTRAQMSTLIDLASGGIAELIRLQRQRWDSEEARRRVEQPGQAARACRRCWVPWASRRSRSPNSASAEAEEPHDTFLENALAKARACEPRDGLAGALGRFGAVRRHAGRRAGRAFGVLRGSRGHARGARRAQQRQAGRDAAHPRGSGGVLLLCARAGALVQGSHADRGRRALARRRSCSSPMAPAASATTRTSCRVAASAPRPSSRPRRRIAPAIAARRSPHWPRA